jgi:hypothetical protein
MNPALKSGTVMSLSTTSQARIQANRFWPGDEQNKENRLGIITVSCSSFNPSGTIHPRADHFFPMGSVVMMKKPNVTQAPPCTGVPFGKRAR